MKFIAHRGYSSRFPENSLPAFAAVVDHPYNGRSIIGIELDIHLTADDRIPVMHETTVPADDGRDIPVADLTFNTLQRFFKRQHGPAIPDVPDINAVLDLVDHRTELCFEVKMGSYDLSRFARLFTDALGFYGPRGDVVVSSFSPDILEFLRPYLRPFGVRFAFIFKSIEIFDAVPVDVRSRFDLLHPWYRLLIDQPGAFSPGGPPIRCWTINDGATMQSLIERTSWLPVEAIMTDDIALAANGSET